MYQPLIITLLPATKPYNQAYVEFILLLHEYPIPSTNLRRSSDRPSLALLINNCKSPKFISCSQLHFLTCFFAHIMNWQEALFIAFTRYPERQKGPRIRKVDPGSRAALPGSDTQHFCSNFIAWATHMTTLILKRQRSAALPHAQKGELVYMVNM